MTTKDNNSKYEFGCANGWFIGYGKDYRHAAQNLLVRKRTVEIEMLVKVFHNKKLTYWDGREFIKELKKGDKIRSKKK